MAYGYAYGYGYGLAAVVIHFGWTGVCAVAALWLALGRATTAIPGRGARGVRAA